MVQDMGIEKSCNDHRQRLKNKSIDPTSPTVETVG
jgi:hypothetical protein